MKETFNNFVHILAGLVCHLFAHSNHHDTGLLKNEYVLFDTLGDINVLSFNK